MTTPRSNSPIALHENEELENLEPPPAYTPYANHASGEVMTEHGPSHYLANDAAVLHPQAQALSPRPSIHSANSYASNGSSYIPPLPPRQPVASPQPQQTYRPTPSTSPPMQQPNYGAPSSTVGSTQRLYQPHTPPTPPSLLNYPPGFWCNKCNNTGYKRMDKPCRQCWDRFSVVGSAPRLTNSELVHQGGFPVPPPSISNGPYSAPLAPPPSQPFQAYPTLHNSVVDHSPPVSPGWASAHQPYPASGYSHPHPPQFQQPQPWPSYGPGPGPVHNHGFPGHYQYQQALSQPIMQPPQAPLVVQPGDPRIGGYLCRRCGGSGRVDTWFLGDELCSTCQGLGRVH